MLLDFRSSLFCQNDTWRRQIVLQTELADEYREIARVLQGREEELNKRQEELRTQQELPENYAEEVQTLQRLIDEKQQALDYASAEVTNMQSEWQRQRKLLQDKAEDLKQQGISAENDVKDQKYLVQKAKLEIDGLQVQLRETKLQVRCVVNL